MKERWTWVEWWAAIGVAVLAAASIQFIGYFVIRRVGTAPDAGCEVVVTATDGKSVKVHSSREQHPDDLNVWGPQLTWGVAEAPYLVNPGLPPIGEGGQWKRRSQTFTVSVWVYEKSEEDQFKAEKFLKCAALYGFDRAANQAKAGECP